VLGPFVAVVEELREPFTQALVAFPSVAHQHRMLEQFLLRA
jgi:hypothetical protein